jgi:hypothetical protein
MVGKNFWVRQIRRPQMSAFWHIILKTGPFFFNYPPTLHKMFFEKGPGKGPDVMKKEPGISFA